MAFNLFKKVQNQAFLPGFLVLAFPLSAKKVLGIVVILAILGAEIFVLSKGHAMNKMVHGQGEVALEALSQSELMRYVYALQENVADNPSFLKGLSDEKIALILAQPELKRTDSPTEIWQYRSEDCIIDIYFVQKSGRTDASIQPEFIEFRQRAEITSPAVKDKVDGLHCMNSLYEYRRADIEAGFQSLYASLSR